MADTKTITPLHRLSLDNKWGVIARVAITADPVGGNEILAAALGLMDVETAMIANPIGV